MKKTIYILFALVFFGCIHDDGNYDYRPVRDLDVKNIERFLVLTEGETAILTPKVIVKYDPEEIAIEGVDCEWQVNRKVVFRGPEFSFKAEKNGSYPCMLRLTDPLTKAVSCYDFTISVVSKYKTGFMILSEEDGKSRLSFIRAKWQSKPDTVIYEGEWKNIYPDANAGQELEGKPVSLNEHYLHDDYHTVLGEVTVVTEDGNNMRIQDLNGESLTRETFIEQEFENGNLPENFRPKFVMHTCWDSFILDESGVVYIRRSSVSTGYHTGYFSDKVKLYNGKLFTDLIFTKYPAMNAVLAIEKNDEGERNYIGIYSGLYRADYNLTRLPIVGDYVDDFKNIQEEIVKTDWRNDENYYAAMSILMKSPEGDYILHCFGTDYTTRSYIEVTGSTKVNLTRDKGIGKVVDMCTNKKKNYTYYCDEHRLYFMENNYGDTGEMHFFDGEKKIVAMECQSIGGGRNYPTALLFAFDDGSVEIWEIDKNDPGKLFKRVYSSKNKFGKIKSIIYKVGGSNTFIYA